MTIVFTGGGTGGHIYPGLAVIEALRAREETASARVIWLGSQKGMDRSIVEGADDVVFFGIHSGKLRRYVSIKNIFDVFLIAAGFFDSLAVLKRERPALLFSKGGFVSVPPVCAARVLRIPVITHESDYSLGLANKINAVFSNHICISYSDTLMAFKQKRREKIVVTGNPVRASFYTAQAGAGRDFLGIPAEVPVLLVLGGSQGAREINELVCRTLPRLCAYFVVVHQTGGAFHEAPPRTARYIPLAYIDAEMPAVLACAALVAGRSGAGTVWECAAAGRPMVLIPLAGSGTRGDQVENARYFERRGAALCLVRPEAARFAETVETLACDTARRAAMAAASSALGATRSAESIARLCARYVRAP
jgi:UDP-N-acetylglucosamine--N-acetylmuramyl-(pentapeptide) pyrophosphoryl-undecaprenol N-acetylglucosamine transferase